MLHYKFNNYVLKELDELVVGHTEMKKALITLVNRSRWINHLKYDRLVAAEFLPDPLKLLLIGPSGTGKTHGVMSLKSLVNFPFVSIDATELNHTGGSGGIKLADVERHIRTVAKDHAFIWGISAQEALDQMVVFIDEIDKLGKPFEGSTGAWNAGTQTHFLTLFDNKDEFRHVSFIFAGAFTNITDNKHATTAKNIGFTHNNKAIDSDKNLDEEIIKFGLIPELVGRINMIVELDTFTEADFMGILENRLLPAKQRELAAMDIFDIDLTHERKRAIVAHAMKSGQGVRALKRELEKEFLELEFSHEENFFKYCMEGL